MIATTANAPAWDFSRKLDAGTRTVAFWGSAPDDLLWVRPDNRAGARLATDRLLERGYRQPMFLGSGDRHQIQFEERLEGYVAMRARGLAPHVVAITDAMGREDQARRAVDGLVQAGPDFDAIVAACDAYAFGALAALRAHSRHVPNNVGVIGFDGVAAGEQAWPPLTTIRPDFQTAGRLLVEAALAPQMQNSRVPVTLIERGSVR